MLNEMKATAARFPSNLHHDLFFLTDDRRPAEACQTRQSEAEGEQKVRSYPVYFFSYPLDTGMCIF